MDPIPQTDYERLATTSATRPRVAAIAAGLAFAAALGWAYRSSFQYLIVSWGDSNYSHGWLIIPIALAILWQGRDALSTIRVAPPSWSILPLIGLLAARYWLYQRNEKWIEAATIPMVIAASVFAVAGWRLLVWALPAILYLFFMIPLPPRFNDLLAGPLQTLATIGSVALLQATGTPVVSEGNVILVGSQRLEVAEACRGLSMLLSFAALITAMVILVKRPIWERAVLLLSIIPIALLCNIIRIAITAIFYAKSGRPLQTVHDWAGLAMMGLALGFVMIELKLLSWLVIEEDEAEAPSLLRASYGADPGRRS